MTSKHTEKLIYDVLRQAIIDKQQVHLEYNDLYRAVCPVIIGTKNGKKRVLTFQFGGESSKGLEKGGAWRCMDVKKIQIIEVKKSDWHVGSYQSIPQTCVDKVDIQAQF
jgi:hypothetical protein